MIIAIDGTSGSGKSTLAKKLAKTLNFGFFSAGALYRAITFKALSLGISDQEDAKLKLLIDTTNISYTFNGDHNIMKVDGIDITENLHDEAISSNVAKYSCKPYIREYVKRLQKDTPKHNKNIVMEGRDIGSVIFPNADFKIYVDCNVETRAKRRFNDISKKDKTLTYEKVLEDLKERDFKDITREISPLIMCEDAYLLDTSEMNVDDCIKQVIKKMISKGLLEKDSINELGIQM